MCVNVLASPAASGCCLPANDVAVVDRPLGQLDALGQIEHCAGLCLGCLACHRVEVRPETVRALALVVIGIGAALVFNRFIRLHRRLDGGDLGLCPHVA